MYMIVGLAQSWHWQCPTTISLLPGRKKKRCLGWSWWSCHCTGILRPVKHCFFFFFEIWITVAVLWPSTAMIICWNIAVIIKNSLRFSAVHTGAIDSIKQPSCMPAMISILQSIADEERKKTHHIFEKNSLMMWLVVTSCPALSWCIITVISEERKSNWKTSLSEQAHDQ